MRYFFGAGLNTILTTKQVDPSKPIFKINRMDVNKLILLLAQYLPKLSETKLSTTIDAISKLLSIDLKTPKKAHTISFAATTAEGELISLEAWLQKIKDATAITSHPLQQNHQLPPHILAAFSNGALITVNIHSPQATTTYCPMQYFSRATAISCLEVEKLLDLQFDDPTKRAELWQEILKLAQCHEKYFEAKTEAEAREFVTVFLETGHASVQDVIRCAQDFCTTQSQKFKIPDNYKAYFYQIDPDQEGAKYWAETHPDRPNEFVPSTEEISFFGEITAAEFVEFVDFQNSGENIWEKLHEHIKALHDFTSVVDSLVDSPELRIALLKLSNNDFNSIPSGNLIMVIQQHIKGLGKSTLIPPHLSDRIKRIQEAYSQLAPEKEIWRPHPNPESWQMIVLQYLEKSPPLQGLQKKVPDINDAKKTLIENLQIAEAFSHKKNSPYEETFRLAQWILNSKIDWLNDFDGGVSAINATGFTEKAENILRKMNNSELYKILGVNAEKARDLLALDVSNVFGGLGSWNDQYFEEEKDQKEYDQITAELYSAHTQFSSLI